MIGLKECEANPEQRRLLNKLKELNPYKYRNWSIIGEDGSIYVLLNPRCTGKRTRARYGVILLTKFSQPNTHEITTKYLKSKLRKELKEARRARKQATLEQIGAFI